MPIDYDQLATKYGGATAAPADKFDALAAKYGATGDTGNAPSGGDSTLGRLAAGAAPAPKNVGTLDRARAAAAGVNRGLFSDLLGMPVDTAANVIDLVKAGVGTAYNEGKQLVTGKGSAPPEWTAPYDRSQITGSSDWIAARLNDAGMGNAINNPNPQDAASRVLHTAGRVAGASVVPNPGARISLTQNLANMTKGGVSGAIAGVVGEVAPEWAGLAGMLPQAATATGAAAFRLGVRGGETGRIAMNQRLQDLHDGGIDTPSVGLASGNRSLMGLENLLAQTPGSIGLYDNAREANLAGMQRKSNMLRDAISREFGPVVAGEAIQNSIKGDFKDRVGATYQALNDRFAGMVPPDQQFPISNTLAALDATTAVNPLAPMATGGLVQPRIAALRRNMLTDTTESVPGAPLFNLPPTTRNVGLPLNATKELRTDIGKEAANRAIFGTPEQADFKQLYAGMSEDMHDAARITDRNAGPQPSNGGPAEAALSRANRYYSNAMTRADDLSSIANRDTPEGAFKSVAGSLNSGPTTYERLRGVLTPEARQKVVASVIDDMGMATPGQQGAAGNTWSPRTFLTNFAKLQENGGGDALFKRLPGGERHAENLASIAKTAEMLGDASKVWSNPSGTAPAMTARGTAYALTAGAFLQPVMAAGTAAGLGLANQASQRLLLNPKFVNWLAKAPSVPPAQAQAYAQRLLANAKMTNDKQFQQDVTDYLRSVEQSAQQSVSDQ